MRDAGRDRRVPEEDRPMSKPVTRAMLIALLAVLTTTTVFAADLNDVVNVLPKFAIPMREVGDRFQNMYFAAKGGNQDGDWTLGQGHSFAASLSRRVGFCTTSAR
jgi:hypothetical protein